jgi:hypothetical protein
MRAALCVFNAFLDLVAGLPAGVPEQPTRFYTPDL